MAERMYWVFGCQHCSTPIWLQLDMLGLPIEDQADLTNPFPSVLAPCIGCRHVGIYSPFPDSPDCAGQVVIASIKGLTVKLGLVQCVDKTCEIQLPLFVTWPEGIKMPWLQEQQESWKWNDLKCQNGHSIQKPE